MYIPKFFRNEDFPQGQQFLRANPFCPGREPDAGRSAAGHAPARGAGAERVRAAGTGGTLCQGQPHWKALATAGQALVVFHGSHHYIPSAWYGHANVPTWNYSAVQVSGAARLQTPEEAAQAIARLMERYEPAAHSRPASTSSHRLSCSAS